MKKRDMGKRWWHKAVVFFWVVMMIFTGISSTVYADTEKKRLG